MSNTQLTLNEAQPVSLSPMQMIQKSLDAALASGDNGLQVASLILDQMAKQRDYEDRERFNAALRRIQDELKPVAKRGWNSQTSSKYATSEDVDSAINTLLEREGMTLSFRPEVSAKEQMVLIVGVLSLGAYSKEYPLEMPADGQGPKGGGVMTRTHATGSAISYGRRYLKQMIFNLKVEDDDGNKAAGKAAMKSLDERTHVNHLENIRNANNKAELQKFYLAALAAAEAVGDTGSIKAFIAAKDKRYKELQ